MLSEAERQRFTRDLERERIGLDEEIKEAKFAQDKARARAQSSMRRHRSVLSHGSITDTVGVSLEEFATLSHRVDRLEHSIASVMSKLDDVILKLHDLHLHRPLQLSSQDKVLTQVCTVHAVLDIGKKIKSFNCNYH